MRINPTVRWVTREAMEDFSYKGLHIKAGTTIHLFTESAGTDPRVFGEPSFDITAERKPHFGFGGGGHHCLGHFVARADMTEALPLLARRLRDPQDPRRRRVAARLRQYRPEQATHQLHHARRSGTAPARNTAARQKQIPMVRSALTCHSAQDHGQCAIAAPSVSSR